MTCPKCRDPASRAVVSVSPMGLRCTVCGYFSPARTDGSVPSDADPLPATRRPPLGLVVETLVAMVGWVALIFAYVRAPTVAVPVALGVGAMVARVWSRWLVYNRQE